MVGSSASDGSSWTVHAMVSVGSVSSLRSFASKSDRSSSSILLTSKANSRSFSSKSKVAINHATNDVETPHTGTSFFTESIQYKSTCPVEDVDFGLGESDHATSIAKLSHAKKVVGESVHDAALVSAWWELW